MIETNDNIQLFKGDCLEIMKNIESNSVNLVLIDPPYNISKDKKWDKWKTVDAYVEFMGQVFLECQRVLKNNGSFYFFHNDFLQIVELQNYINKNTDFIFNSFIIWDKGDFRALSWKNPSEKNNLRSWFNTCEYCLYYTFQDETGLKKIKTDMNNFKNLRKYSKELQNFIGLKIGAINKKLKHRKSEHFFYHSSTQWDLCTIEVYKELIKLFNIDKWEGFREYEDLRKEYEDLRKEYESLRYIHNLDTNHNNIWKSKAKRNSGKLHACEKPVDILERIIRTSSNEGDVVLDCFAGSGSTGIACINTNRNFIGIELDDKYFKIAYDRIFEHINKNQRI